MGDRKVVYVDFNRRRRPTRGGFGGTPRQLFAVFAAVLAAQLLVAAAAMPRWIASGFFAPTVIAVAVAATLGFRRLAARRQIAQLHRRAAEAERPFRRDDERGGRTLH